MKIKSGSNYIPAPEGVFEGVCVDVVDLGMVDGQYGKKHKLKIVWEIAPKMADGRPFTVSQRYTASLHKQSNLFPQLESWRGRPFTSDELKEFEMENVIGAPCLMVIKQVTRDGTVYANVVNLLKSAVPITPSGKYVRAKDKEGYVPPAAADAGVQEHPENDADEKGPF